MAWIGWRLGSYVLSLSRADSEERDLGLMLAFTMGAVGSMSLTYGGATGDAAGFFRVLRFTP